MPVLALLVFAISVITLIDVITRPDDKVKYIPKMIWLILVIIIPVAGAIAWWLVGREYEARPAGEGPILRRREPAPRPAAAPQVPFDRRTTEQQLADLDREIEEERLRAEIAKRKAQSEGA